METMSLAGNILQSGKPFVFYHTYSVTRETLQRAIDEGRSMDLDVCIDGEGNLYIGHSKQYGSEVS